jgi:hypothetical protein
MRFTFDIPDLLYRRLKRRAVREGCLVEDLILRSIEYHLRLASLPLIRSKRPGKIRLDHARIFEVIPFP